MNGINSKDRFSFAKGYRARTIFLIFDILLLGILMCMMVLPLLKVIVDSIDPTSYGVRLWPRKIETCAYCDTEFDMAPDVECVPPDEQDAHLARTTPAQVAAKVLELLG